MKAELDGADLNAGPAELVRAMVSDPGQVSAGARAGRLREDHRDAHPGHRLDDDVGYTIIGLAPSAAAAAVLGEATGMPTETLAKLDHILSHGPADAPASARAPWSSSTRPAWPTPSPSTRSSPPASTAAPGSG